MTLEEQNDRMKAALSQIAAMSDPDDIKEDEDGFTEWGCDRQDAINMAYENCITIAQLALGDVSTR